MPFTDAFPPAGAVPVESALIERFYAARDWAETEALLADDFVWIDDDTARGAKDFKSSQQWGLAAYEDIEATIDTIVADLEHPTVLYVRDATRGRARYRDRPDLDVVSWVRIIVTPSGTRIRALGPMTIIARRA
jgi:hypothetical protein